MSMSVWPPKVAYTLDEAMFASGISRRQLFRAIERGELRAAWVAGRRRIVPADLELYVRGQPMPDTTAPKMRSVSTPGHSVPAE
jgi:hypothetical protein